MTARFRTPWFLALAGLALAGAAAASPPDPRFSTFDPVGVGTSTGSAVGGSPVGFDVSARDVNNAPLLGCLIRLNFSGTGVRVLTTQNAGTTVFAAEHVLERRATTGSTNFAVRSGGYCNQPGVEVSGNGVVLGFARWRSTDIDGVDGRTGLTDLNRVGTCYLGATVAPECNFDLSTNDVPDLADLTIAASEYASGATGAYAW